MDSLKGAVGARLTQWMAVTHVAGFMRTFG